MTTTTAVGWALWRARWFIWWRREDRALAVVQAALRQHPNDAQLLAYEAHLLAELQRPREALAVLARLVQVAPDGAAHWFNQGFLQERLGELDAAEASFRQALTLDERLDRAWYGLGLVLMRLGRLDEALAALRRNTELQPMSPYAWYQMARIHADRAEAEEAVRIIRHLQGFEPRVAAQLERETGLRAAQTA
ncbi:tetratricopeptide repeat protein [Tepidimonas sp.]|uniref:tetratricopeptide repeat protein n=1 Tax=Tepidimonas sp. TaxID=2002775 RepID=UPI002FDF6511